MKKKLSLLLSIISFCLFGNQQLKSQSLVHGIIEAYNSKRLNFITY